ncbi:GNAT family N-acetyltransferase [Aurantiacibacter sp. MUD11]|uniref:GNAT family N-acetyltransferase n=1 Tax=Aurantiacibacter sp. MUD11 TaxID=3003265 RepID=UPI0022AA94DD|nr:GNAT family N-acetyltransferase [Aurantiacibacter sp. MUD11]WAT18839.1 GNAT family N-acetyltransferase [Aurantiacibacter sp. MUD11]
MPLPRLGAFDHDGFAQVREVASTDARITARRWRDFEQRGRITAWDALAACAAEPNPFYESWYLLPALRALASDEDVQMLMLETNGQIAGLLPVRRERDYYGYPLPHLRNWVHPNCFLGLPLVARGFERQFWRALFKYCDANPGTSLFLHLMQVPANGPLHEALVQVLAQDKRPAATVHREERAMLASTASPEEYLEGSLSAKKRKELRRQHRRLSDEGKLTFERLTDYTDIAVWTREFLSLEARGWKGNAGSAMDSDGATSSLFTYAIAGAAARGRLERLSLRLDGKPIAMLANFLTPPGAYAYKTAFDEAYSRFSPGVLLQRENLAMLDRADIEWIDSCAAEDHPMIDHIWRERRTIARHSFGIGGSLRRMLFRAIARRETGQPGGGIL